MKSEVRVCKKTVNNKSVRVMMKKRRDFKSRSSQIGAVTWGQSAKKQSCRSFRQKVGNSGAGSGSPRLSVECRALLQNRLNFEKSGIPEKLMFYLHGGWMDFPVETVEKLRRDFIARNPCVEVEIDGSLYLVDFLRMLQTDLRACFQRSIAWMDCNGKCFFPKFFVSENGSDGACGSSPFKLEIEICIDKTKGSKAGNGNQGADAVADRISEASRTREKEIPMLAHSKVKYADDNLGVERVRYEMSPKLANGADVKKPNTNSGCAGVAAELKQNEVSSKCNNGVQTVSLNAPIHVKTNNFTDGFCDSVTRKPTSIKRSLDAAAEGNKDMILDDGSIPRKKVLLADMPNGPVAVYKTPKVEILYDDLNEKKLPSEGECGFLHISNELHEGNDMNVCDFKEKTQSVAQDFLGSPTSASGRSKYSSGLTTSFSLQKPKSERHELPAVVSRFPSLGTKLILLNENEKTHCFVKNMFMRGVGKVDPEITINAIYQYSRESPFDQVRLQAFQRHVDMAKNSRGDANVKYAWHGTSAKGVESIFIHGFGLPKTCCGSDAYGVGIYLSQESFSELSAFCVEPDENGEQHVVLCQVITGNVEKVRAGSSQFHPTDESSDIGVDNLINPRYYIVWSTHMNSHIFPEYIVSFKASDHVREAQRTKVLHDSCVVPEHSSSPAEIAKSTPKSPSPVVVAERSPCASTRVYGQIKEKVTSLGMTPNMSLPALFNVMQMSLNHSNIDLLRNLYGEYKAGKIGKDTLIKKIRSIAGDKLLINAINAIRHQA